MYGKDIAMCLKCVNNDYSHKLVLHYVNEQEYKEKFLTVLQKALMAENGDNEFCLEARDGEIGVERYFDKDVSAGFIFELRLESLEIHHIEIIYKNTQSGKNGEKFLTDVKIKFKGRDCRKIKS